MCTYIRLTRYQSHTESRDAAIESVALLKVSHSWKCRILESVALRHKRRAQQQWYSPVWHNLSTSGKCDYAVQIQLYSLLLLEDVYMTTMYGWQLCMDNNVWIYGVELSCIHPAELHSCQRLLDAYVFWNVQWYTRHYHWLFQNTYMSETATLE